MSYQYLWTPWRMQYITGSNDGGESAAREEDPPVAADEADLPQKDSTGCVFCDRARMPTEHDRANLVLLRGERNFVILNLYPYNNGHLLVVPNRHIPSLAAATPEELCELIELTRRSELALTEAYSPHGINMGINLGKPAGAGVLDHVHMHVVPRWSGDTNFMTVVGETRVLPEELRDTAQKLRPIFEKLARGPAEPGRTLT